LFWNNNKLFLWVTITVVLKVIATISFNHSVVRQVKIVLKHSYHSYQNHGKENIKVLRVTWLVLI